MEAEKGSDEFEAWFAAEYPNTHANCENPDHPNDQIIKAFAEVSWRHSRKAVTAEIEKLKAENDALRNLAVELRGAAKCYNLHHCKAEQHAISEPCKVLARIDAAMTK